MPIKKEELDNIIREGFPEADIQITDIAGDEDHYEIKIVWSGFAGKSLIEQHKMVHKLIDDKNIHATSIKTSME